MPTKKNEYRVYRTAEPEVLTYEDVKDRNPSGFPTTYVSDVLADEGVEAFILFEMCGLCNTRGEARRLLKQGGGYRHIHGTSHPKEFQTISGAKEIIGIEHFENGVLFLRAGKKKLHRLEIL
jgi:tyrosyl-tRNA synthetase